MENGDAFREAEVLAGVISRVAALLPAAPADKTAAWALDVLSKHSVPHAGAVRALCALALGPQKPKADVAAALKLADALRQVQHVTSLHSSCLPALSHLPRATEALTEH